MEDEQVLEIIDLVKIFLKRAKSDKDVALAISGYEGEGKSTLASGIVIETLRELGRTDEEILERFDEYMIYSPKKQEMFDKITRPEKYAPINSDEAVKALYKLNWASAGQKFLNMLFQLCRQENKINIFCIPRFTDLNEYFRNHRVMFWIHILETGIAVLMIRDWSPFSRDPWYIDENRKIIDLGRKKKKINDFDIMEKINLMKKTRGFVGVVRWPDLTPEFKKVYRAGKGRHKYADMEENEVTVGSTAEKLKEVREMVATTLRAEGKTTKQIAQILGVSERSVFNYLSATETETNPLIINEHSRGDNFDKS